MTCTQCGNDKAWHLKSGFNPGTGERYESCDRCGLEAIGTGIPDVYLPRAGMRFQNLTDNMGKPIEIRSKAHKKEVMDKLGVSEAGDRVNGATFTPKTWVEGTRDYRRKQFEKDRPMIREMQRKYLENARNKR